MNPLHILLILRAHYIIALITMTIVLVAGIAVSLKMPKEYTTSTAVVFEIRQDPVAGALLPVMPGYVATQVDIIRSNRVSQKVVKALNLDENPLVRQQWMAATKGKGQIHEWFGDVLRRSLRVSPTSGSSIINISYTASDPSFAALVANAFAQAYIDASIELRVDPARQYSRWFGEQAKSLRENLEKSQARLSEFQQSKGIVARDEQLDAETTKLNELSSHLTAVQNQLGDAESKRRSSADTLPEVMSNSLIQGLRSDIARQEAKLQEVAGNLGRNHPQYLRMESEIAALKQRLEIETRHFTSSFSTTKAVSKDRETELKAAIAAQKKKLLEIKHDRDQLAVLQRDVDAAQRAYDTVTQRFNQTTLESQVTQANVSVLTPATEPVAPSSPNIPRNITISVLLGILLGCGTAFVREFFDRRVRSVDDLSEMLQLPVLAVIERPKEPRLPFLRRLALSAPR